MSKTQHISMPTETVHVDLGSRSYDILVSSGSIASAGASIAQSLTGTPRSDGRTVVVVSNATVLRLHGKPLIASLESAGFDVLPITLPAGETFKTLNTVRLAYDALYANAVDRRTLVVALGGGVIGDVAGFIASSYQRGLDLVQIPTTLLSQVDSSVGGKVGVNFSGAKNLIGAFHQPKLVLIDPESLKTLPLRERRSGMAEVIKYGAIADVAFFEHLSREIDGLLKLTSPFLQTAIAHSCRLKARIVEQDERETGSLRATLNFGHTVGHALESLTRYRRYRHGEAIALGMVSACLIGEELGVTQTGVTKAIVDLLIRSGFEVRLSDDLDIDEIVRLLAHDKKSVNRAARFVLLERLGSATTGHVVTDEVVRTALLRQRGLFPG